MSVLHLAAGFGAGSQRERTVVQRETRYAKSSRVNVAYQVVGDGPTDLILVPGFVSHVEVAWEEPRLAHFLGRLASFSRLIVFDKRGTGMSDPVASPPSMDQRMDDIRTVMDAAGSGRGTIFGISEGGTLGLLFSHAHPERTQALILYGSWARRLAGPDYPYGPSAEQLEEVIDGMDRAGQLPAAEQLRHPLTGLAVGAGQPGRFGQPRAVPASVDQGDHRPLDPHEQQ
jgi:pimeloyl-ACP methyl ester carboxylesterase